MTEEVIKVFVTGHIIENCEAGIVWDILGVFSERGRAEAACYDEACFVGPLKLNLELPKEIVSWPDCYFPLSQGS